MKALPLLLLSASFVRAATYYVAPSGNDAADGSIGTPWERITNSLPKISGGDTLYLRAGTYGEWINNLIPAGANWGTATILSSYNGETVTLNPATPTDTDIIRIQTAAMEYIIINGLTLDGVNMTNGGNGVKITYTVAGQPATHIRFSNCTVKNIYDGMGVLLTSSQDYSPTFCEFTNCTVFGAGYSGDQDPNKHGFYVSTSGNTFDSCTVFSNLNLGFHFFNGRPSTNIVRNCTFAQTAGDAIGLYGGTNNQFYNNVFYGGNVGIVINPSDVAGGTLIANNTFATNGVGVLLQNAAQNAGNTAIVNNVITDQTNATYGAIHLHTGVSSAATITVSNNVMVGSGLKSQIYDEAGSATLVNNLTNQSSVSFVAPLAGDFRLQSPSLARGVGAVLAEFGSDKIGNLRGASWDAGAYEYSLGTVNAVNVGTMILR